MSSPAGSIFRQDLKSEADRKDPTDEFSLAPDEQ